MTDLSPRLINGVKGFEGYRATPYWDFKQYTSGYGTRASGPNETVDKATAESRLQDSLTSAARQVDAAFPGLPPGTRDALTSLTFNAGPGWMQSGLGNAIRSGDMDQARALFGQYNHAGGQVNAGLTQRRATEAGWFDQAPPRPPMPIPQAAPNVPLFPPNAMASAQQPPAQQQAMPQQPQQPPQAAGQAPAPSIWAMLGLPQGAAPNLPLYDFQKSYGG